MSWQTIKYKEVKIRKPHWCHGCLEKHEPPSKMKYCFSVDGGDTSQTYWCEVCDAFYTQHIRDFDEGIYEGDFKGEDAYETFKQSYLNKQIEKI